MTDLTVVHPNLDGVKLLNGHISDNEVSLSYLLEYVLKDFLPDKKRYINRLYEIGKLKKQRDMDYGIPLNPATHGKDSFADSPQSMKNLEYFNSANPKIDSYMLYNLGDLDYNSRGNYNSESQLKNCRKCKMDSKYFSIPNLNSPYPSGKEDE